MNKPKMLFISHSFTYKTHFPCFVLWLSTGQKSNHILGKLIIQSVLNTMILNFSIRLESFSISAGTFLITSQCNKGFQANKDQLFHPRGPHTLLQWQKNFTGHRPRPTGYLKVLSMQMHLKALLLSSSQADCARPAVI